MGKKTPQTKSENKQERDKITNAPLTTYGSVPTLLATLNTIPGQQEAT